MEKHLANFRETSNTGGQNTFCIGSDTSIPRYNSQKHIAYLSLYHGRFSTIDIKRQHKYLCKRYKIDHDPITLP